MVGSWKLTASLSESQSFKAGLLRGMKLMVECLACLKWKNPFPGRRSLTPTGSHRSKYILEPTMASRMIRRQLLGWLRSLLTTSTAAKVAILKADRVSPKSYLCRLMRLTTNRVPYASAARKDFTYLTSLAHDHPVPHH